MTVDELIKRIREKESPEKAESLISHIKKEDESYAKNLMFYYDDIHMKYDTVLYGEAGNGVLFVEKDKMYGIVDKNGNEIIPCKFKNYYDAYREWQEMGFPKEPTVLTGELLVAQQFKDGLRKKHDELMASGGIKSITFYNERTINGAEFVKMSDGSIGMAASVMIYDSERGKNIEIKNADGEHVMYLSEPELFKGLGTPGTVICSDENNLYVATYNTEFSYIACYRMGDFEKVWKTPMYGSRLQSITVNDNEVIVFDMNDGRIKYLDKTSGIRKERKSISTEKHNDYGSFISQHELAATNEKLLAGVPLGLLSFESELKIFDNASGESISQKNVSQFIGTLKSLTIDKINNRLYIAFDDKIAVFDENGYLGYFLAPTTSVHQLNFDQETGYLLISMTEGKGKVEIYSPETVTTLLETSRALKTQLEGKMLGTTSESTEGQEVVQELFNNNLETSKHI